MPNRRVLVACLAGLGLVTLLVGVGLRTIWLPDDQVVATADLGDDPGLVATTAPGLLEARPGPVTVRAQATDGGPVLLAVGRQGDVEAYVEGLDSTTLTGFDDAEADVIITERVEGEPPAEDQPALENPALENPAQSDLWVQTETGTGSATLTYEPPPGRWLLLAAGDGTTPAPSTLTITWPQEVRTPWSTPLIVLGAVLMLAASALFVLLRRWERETSVPPLTRPTRSPDQQQQGQQESHGPAEEEVLP